MVNHESQSERLFRYRITTSGDARPSATGEIMFSDMEKLYPDFVLAWALSAERGDMLHYISTAMLCEVKLDCISTD